MDAERKIARELAKSMADDRAHRIASAAAEDLIRCEGEAAIVFNEYAIPQCQADDHMRECVAHLCWNGEAASYETDEGIIVVQFGDFARTAADNEMDLTFEDALRIARGCTDYGGGRGSNAEHSGIYQHGIQTVINALTAARDRGLGDTQVRALHAMGAGLGKED